MEKQDRKQMLAAYKERKVMGGVYAIVNSGNGKMLLLSALDLPGAKHRFEFSQKTGSCIHPKLQADWKNLGAEGFHFKVVEELEKKETQTSKEFGEDIKILTEMWLEKLDPDKLY